MAETRVNCIIDDRQALEGEVEQRSPTPRRQRRVNLATLRGVRKELAYVYRLIDSGAIPAQEGTRRAYVLRQVADVIEVADLERRLQALEQRRGPQALPGTVTRLN